MTCPTSVWHVRLVYNCMCPQLLLLIIIKLILWEGASWKLPSWVVHCYNKVVLSVGMAGEALECVWVCVKERGEGMAWEVQNSYY